MKTNAAACLLIVLLTLPVALAGDEPSSKPEIRAVVPPVLAAGGVRTVTLYGQDLKAREITFAMGGLTARVLAAAPHQAATDAEKQRGNTAVTVEITVPADAPRDLLEFTLVTEGGGQATGKVLIDDPRPEIEEAEPNDSLRRPQLLTAAPVTLIGRIAGVDADVFSFRGRAGEKWTFETQAVRIGSPLDPGLRLRDARGIPLAVAVDNNKQDARLAFSPPADGVYTLEIFDVDNRDRQDLTYRLAIRRRDPSH